MSRTSMIAALALSLIGLGACGEATLDRAYSGAGSDHGSNTAGGLAVGAPTDDAAIGAVPDGAIDAPGSRNRMHIGKPLPPTK